MNQAAAGAQGLSGAHVQMVHCECANGDVNHGYYGGGCCYHNNTAAVVAATAIVTAAVIGSRVNTLPPACTVVIMNGLTYQQCGSTWYQPQFVGTTTTYLVVAAPR